MADRPANLIRGLFELVRLPTLPTALTNALAGSLAVATATGRARGRDVIDAGTAAYQIDVVAPSAEADPLGFFSLATLPWGTIGCVAAVSAMLYMAGMLFNDVADRRRDIEKAPTRPLVRGAVPLALAWAIGVVLVGGALAISFATLPLEAAIVAMALAVGIQLYDWLPRKETWLGVTVMAVCRLLNALFAIVAVGLAIVPNLAELVRLAGTAHGATLWLYPTALYLWIWSVTLVSTLEDNPVTGLRYRLAVGLGIASLAAPWFANLIATAAFASGPSLKGVPPAALIGPLIGLLLAAALALRVGVHVHMLGIEPARRHAGLSVKWGVFGVSLFDAALIATMGWPVMGLAAALMFGASIGLAKMFPRVPRAGRGDR